MTVEQLQSSLQLKTLCMPAPSREITGGHTGDLLSFVMGSAEEGQAWITIMSNVNVIAVATLTDVSCVILSCGVAPDDGVLERAKEKGVNLLSSSLSSFELCAAVGALLQ